MDVTKHAVIEVCAVIQSFEKRIISHIRVNRKPLKCLIARKYVEVSNKMKKVRDYSSTYIVPTHTLFVLLSCGNF